MSRSVIGLVSAIGLACSMSGCAQPTVTATAGGFAPADPANAVRLPERLRADQVVHLDPSLIRDVAANDGDRQIQRGGGGRGGGGRGGSMGRGGRGGGWGGRGGGWGGRGGGWGGRGHGGHGHGGFGGFGGFGFGGFSDFGWGGWGGLGWGGYGWDGLGLGYYPYAGNYYPYYNYAGSYVPYYLYNAPNYYQPYLTYGAGAYTPAMGAPMAAPPTQQYAVPNDAMMQAAPDQGAPSAQINQQVASVSVYINMPPAYGGYAHKQ